MIRTIIVEDEASSRELLLDLLSEYCPQIEVVATCPDVPSAKKSITSNEPELVFMDIELSDSTSFDLLSQLTNINFEVIFTTAHNKYAQQAIKFSALDFLLKPIDGIELVAAISKAEQRINKNQYQQQIDILLQNIRFMNEDRKIALPTARGLEFVMLKDLIRGEGNNNYTHFHIKERGKIIVSKTLREFEEMLSEFNFFRVHQSHLVNLRYVKHYDRGDGGSLTLEDGSVVPVARNRKAELMRRLNNLL